MLIRFKSYLLHLSGWLLDFCCSISQFALDTRSGVNSLVAFRWPPWRLTNLDFQDTPLVPLIWMLHSFFNRDSRRIGDHVMLSESNHSGSNKLPTTSLGFGFKVYISSNLFGSLTKSELASQSLVWEGSSINRKTTFSTTMGRGVSSVPLT